MDILAYADGNAIWMRMQVQSKQLFRRKERRYGDQMNLDVKEIGEIVHWIIDVNRLEALKEKGDRSGAIRSITLSENMIQVI